MTTPTPTTTPSRPDDIVEPATVDQPADRITIDTATTVTTITTTVAVPAPVQELPRTGLEGDLALIALMFAAAGAALTLITRRSHA